MLLFVGQVARPHQRREAFQEIDCQEVFGSLAKGVFELDDVDRIPEVVASAFSLASSGRQGPVVISLPEDVLADEGEAPDATPYVARQPSPAADDMAALTALLGRAERPLVLVGGGPWDAEAAGRITDWIQANGLPVVASFRRQDTIDNRLPCYAGDAGLGINPRLAARFREADLLIAVGARLTEVETSGYTLLRVPVPEQVLVHVHPDPDELGRVYQPQLGILSGVREFAAALSQASRADGGRWSEWAADARADYEAWSEPPEVPGGDAGVDLGEVIRVLRTELPEDAILCSGAGNYTVWIHRFFRYRRWGTQAAPQSGAMGYGVPAALAAQLLHPDRTSVALAGDGCFQMAAPELATIVQEGLPIVVIVANNQMLGTIRMHQERRYPGRVIGTDLRNPDFTALARSFGLAAERVERSEDFRDAFSRARDSGGPALIELRTDPQAVTPAISLDELRAQGLAASGARS